jgi:hypothetical protein
MKIVTLALLAILATPIYAYAQDDQDEQPPAEPKPLAEMNPMEEMQQVIQCQAVDMSLLHTHIQIAASLTALAGPTGVQKLQPMIDSYKALAEIDQHRFDDLMKVAKEAIIPELSGKVPESIKESAGEALSMAMSDIIETLNNPQMTYMTQTTAEKALMDEAGRCEAFGVVELKRHTI